MPKPSDLSTDILSRLRAVVLLGGTVRSTGLTAAIGRSVLELPITAGRSLLDLWCDQTSQLARMVGRKLLVRVLIDKAVQPPKSVADHPQIDLEMQRDPFELRGTGGILKDATADLTDDDYFLIAAANQVVNEPLARVAESLAGLGGDVSVIAHEEGQPSNIMLLRRGVLKNIPDIGFSDLKEQAMPAIAREHSVQVKFYPQAIGMPVRTLKDYIQAVRWYHRSLKHDPQSADPFSEDCVSTFSIVEEAANMHSTAQAMDSVVLAGAKVGRNAMLVRSVVCPGATVPDNATAMDQVVSIDSPRTIFRKQAARA
jgi:hypothetical protein